MSDQVVASTFERDRTLYNPWHYIAALGRKPGAMTRLREHLAKHPDGDRQFVEILSMVSLYGLEAVSEVTKIHGPVKWSYYHLYVILDIFSRYVVGWMLAYRETAELAEQMIAETIGTQNITPGTLTLHADRGTSMRSKPVAALLVDLQVAKTHSRPHVSDANPYSEAQFKTLKYRPDFPERFGSIEDARAHCQTFFVWYNTQHHHSGIGLMSPDVVHHGRAGALTARRAITLDAAFIAHPNRFKGVAPQPPRLPDAAWINPPKKDTAQPTTTIDCSLNS